MLTIVGFVLYLLTLFLICIVTFPVMLRSGAMLDFKAGFSKTFILSFLKKVGLSMLGWLLLVGLISIPFMLIGYFALIVGVYLVAAIVQFAMFHILFQHYDLFLERGGEPLQVDPEVIKEYAAPPIPNQAPPEQMQ